MKDEEAANSTDLSLLGLDPGKLVWGQLGKIWYPARVSSPILSSPVVDWLQVAWKKKAPHDVVKLEKSETVLVHWFDRWSEVHSKPSMYSCLCCSSRI